MIWAIRIRGHLARCLRRFLGDSTGTTLVELALVVPIFLLFLLGLLDFARLGYDYVFAQKAMERAARIATVRPPACAGVPSINIRASSAGAGGTVPPPFGSSCNAGGAICANPGIITCTADLTNPTAQEIWTLIQPLLPYGTTASNLHFSYSYDPDLGFLGGPYVPIVSVELSGMTFSFIQPINGLAQMAGGAASITPTMQFPPIRVSMPGEDLAQGNDG